MTRRYGVVDPATRDTLSGLEFVQALAGRLLPFNPMAQILGYEIVDGEAGRVVVTAEPGTRHLNPAGTVHGGLAATMLDSCMGLAVESTLDVGWLSTTLEFKISFVRPITPLTGPIRAEGVVLHRGRRIGTAEGRVLDPTGKLLVHGTSTCLIYN